MTRHRGIELLIHLGIATCVVAAITGHRLALLGLAAIAISASGQSPKRLPKQQKGVGPSDASL